MSIHHGSTDGETRPASDPAAELTALRARLEALEAQVAFERECFDEAARENSELRTALMASIDASEDSQLGRLRLLFDGLCQQFERLKQRPTVSHAELTQLQTQINTLTEERNAARDQLSVLQQEVTGYQQRASSAESQQAELEKQLRSAQDTLRKERTQQSQTLADKNRQLDDAKRDARIQRETVERLRIAHDGLNDRYQQLLTQVQRQRTAEEQLREQLEAAKQAEIAATALATEQVQRLEEMDRLVKTLEAARTDLEAQNAALAYDLQAAEQLTNDANQQREALTEELKKRAPTLSLDDLEGRLTSGFASILSVVHEARARAVASVASPPPASPSPTSTDEGRAQKEETAQIREAIMLLEKEYGPLQRTNIELDRQQAALRSSIHQLKIDIEACAKKDRPSLQAQLKSAEQEHDRIAQVRNPIQDRLMEIERRLDPLRHRLETYRELEHSIREYLQPLPEFTPPSLDAEPEPPAKPEPPVKAVEVKQAKTRVSKAPPPPPEAVEPAPPPPDTISLERYQSLAEKHQTTQLIAFVVSLIAAVDLTSIRQAPSLAHLFQAAEMAGICHPDVLPRETSYLYQPSSPLRKGPVTLYVTYSVVNSVPCFVFQTKHKKFWRSPLSNAQVARLNQALLTLQSS